MKNKVLIGIFLTLILTGCNKEKYMTCKIDINNKDQGYILSAEYKVYYKNDYVTKIDKKEVYTSSSEETINYFDDYKNLEYENLNKLYGGYSYNVEKSQNKVVLKSTINMTEVNIKKMLMNNYLNNDYVLSAKMTLNGASYFYEAKGAQCDI